jgi:protein ImuB
MLWLALHPPQLSLEAFCAGLPPGGAAQPVALMAEHQVQQANAAAAACGVLPGQRRATALALAPALHIGQAEPARDHQALLALAHAALAFTPAVALQGRPEDEPATATATATSAVPDIVLLEVSTCLRYFGGHTKLLRRLRAELAPLGHQLNIASAATAEGAALLARWRADLAEGPQATQRQALAALLNQAPLALFAPAQAARLEDMGLHRLADLRQLPRAGLARRLGEALLLRLDRAYGQRADPRTWLSPPEVFVQKLELHARADNAAQLLHAAQLLLVRLVAWARARQGQVAAFTLHMHHELRHRGADTPATTALRIELAAPSHDAAHLQWLLRERLQRQPLPAPTLELGLRCEELVQRAPPSGELFPTRAASGEGFARLLERLRARLGPAQVQALVAVADHRPEKAAGHQAHAHVGKAGQTAAQPARAVAQHGVGAPGLPLHRPLWLLEEPLLLARSQPPRLLEGPQRIEAGWWESGQPGGAPVARDYYIAQDSTGALIWVFCERLPPREATGPRPSHEDGPSSLRWYLQGLYA